MNKSSRNSFSKIYTKEYDIDFKNRLGPGPGYYKFEDSLQKIQEKT